MVLGSTPRADSYLFGLLQIVSFAVSLGRHIWACIVMNYCGHWQFPYLLTFYYFTLCGPFRWSSCYDVWFDASAEGLNNSIAGAVPGAVVKWKGR